MRKIRLDCQDHLYADGEFCTTCGGSMLDGPDDDYDPNLRWKILGAWAGLIGGGGSVGLGLTLAMRYQIFSVGRGEDAIPRDDPRVVTAYWLVRGGALLLVASVVALLFLPALKRRRYLI